MTDAIDKEKQEGSTVDCGIHLKRRPDSSAPCLGPDRNDSLGVTESVESYASIRPHFCSARRYNGVDRQLGTTPDAVNDLAKDVSVVAYDGLEMLEDPTVLQIFEAGNPYQRDLSHA